MTIAEQAAEVRRVKRSESGMIQDPVTLSREASVGDALAIMKEHRIGGIPVVDETNTLVGIVTNRDLRFEKNYDRAVAEVMTDSNLIVTQDGSDFEKAEQLLRAHRIEKCRWLTATASSSASSPTVTSSSSAPSPTPARTSGDVCGSLRRRRYARHH